ncbi:hypothetical protein [Bacillus suaedae]|uniref:Flagellar protein FliT n=1 Tax=Halalkalibacter suaedae TaxID=2822140 RepID=A0A940WPA8_9BACI|nr:hypothetical protein [Bacillus suaedae]MBP3950030.1 hypothetical protein [Bacillus suaedae]
MDRNWLQLVDVSERLLDQLNRFPKVDGDEREVAFTTIESLLAEREQFITLIQSPAVTEEEKQVGNHLLKLNRDIEQGLARLTNQLKLDIDRMKHKKKINRKYDNPYDVGTNEGAFIDKRST